MNSKRYLGATALMLVLGAPAYGQTNIDQFTNATTVQSMGNSAIVSVPGVVANSFASQSASNQLNAVGPGAYVGVSDSFVINQSSGAQSTSALFQPLVSQTAVNAIGANSTAPAVANVAAGGNQSATNAVNLANFAPLAGANGSLTQVVANNTLSASNSMTATVSNGNASVLGSNGEAPGFQSAFGSLNTAGVLVDTTATLQLQQKLGDANSVSATNSAVANAIASGSTILDPAVQNVGQTSGVGINQLSLASNGAAAVALDGSQNGTTPQDGFIPDPLLVNIGNTVAAYTGPTNTATYNLGAPGVGGNGIAVVSGVTQSSSFGLNNVSGGADVSLSLSSTLDPGLGFNQSVDGSNQHLSTAGGNSLPGVVNGIVARTDQGTATITGVARTQASDAFTQSFTNQQNALSTGGSISGTATQTVADISAPTPQGYGTVAGYTNAAVANANVGPASLAGVSQNMNQTLNTVSGGGAAGLTLGQDATNVALGGNNVQIAGGSNNASITGAQQLNTTGVNVASVGAASGLLSQNATSVTLASSNQLTNTSGFNATVSGSQSSSSSINVVK